MTLTLYYEGALWLCKRTNDCRIRVQFKAAARVLYISDMSLMSHIGRKKACAQWEKHP